MDDTGIIGAIEARNTLQFTSELLHSFPLPGPDQPSGSCGVNAVSTATLQIENLPVIMVSLSFESK
jgi:hypothetical protein